MQPQTELFTDSAESTSAIFTQLYNIVSPYLTHFRNDLIKTDRAILENYNGPFIYGYRTSGTTLLKLHANLADYCNSGHTPTTADERDIKDLIVYISGPLCNKRFLHYDGKKLRHITENQAREIYANHIDKLIYRARAKRDIQLQAA